MQICLYSYYLILLSFIWFCVCLFYFYLHLSACVSFYIVYYLIYKSTLLFQFIRSQRAFDESTPFTLLRNNYLRISIRLHGNDLIRKYSLLFRKPCLFMTLAKLSFFIAQRNVYASTIAPNDCSLVKLKMLVIQFNNYFPRCLLLSIFLKSLNSPNLLSTLCVPENSNCIILIFNKTVQFACALTNASPQSVCYLASVTIVKARLEKAGL